MPSYTCYPRDDPTANWAYCPYFGAAITFSCLFGLVSIAHIVQAIRHKKPFSWVLIMGSVWECCGYSFRTLSVTAQKETSWATTQSLFILLAPLWINAFVYMVLGRMVQFFLDDRRVYGVKAKHFTWIFVSLDILSFLVQATGGVMASGQNAPQSILNGLHIYMGGLGLQEFIILVFASMAFTFQKKLALQQQGNLEAGEGVAMTGFRSPYDARKLLWIVYIVLGLITFRIIFRLIEFSQGINSYIPTHEWFPYVFDAVPMLAALIIVNVVHPGSILQGPNSDFTEERGADKQKKKEKKEAKKMEQTTRKAGKKETKEMEKMEKENKKAAKKGVAVTVQGYAYSEV